MTLSVYSITGSINGVHVVNFSENSDFINGKAPLELVEIPRTYGVISPLLIVGSANHTNQFVWFGGAGPVGNDKRYVEVSYEYDLVAEFAGTKSDPGDGYEEFLDSVELSPRYELIVSDWEWAGIDWLPNPTYPVQQFVTVEYDVTFFTENADFIDFNAIASSGSAWEGNPYEALNGDDVVTLPSEANAPKVKDKDGKSVFQIAGLNFLSGAGNDSIDGRKISSHGISISGGKDDDHIWGGQRRDVLLGESGSDTIRGGSGDDSIYGNDDVDYIYGDGDDDALHGGVGADFLYGGGGDDSLFGSDILPSDSSDADYMDGGGGTDTFYAADGDTIKGVEVGERIYLQSFADAANLIVIRQKDGTYVQLLDPITASQTVRIEERIRADAFRIGEDTKGLLYIERVPNRSKSAFQDPIEFWEAFSKNMGAAILEKRTPVLARLAGEFAADSTQFGLEKAWEYIAKRFPSEFAKKTPAGLVFSLSVVAVETWKVAGKAWGGEYKNSVELERALFSALSSFIPFKDTLDDVGAIGSELSAIFIDAIVKSFIEVKVNQIVGFFSQYSSATDGADIQIGDGESNYYYPGDGSDKVRSRGGDDYVQGGSGGGDDLYDMGKGFDTVGYQSTRLGITVDLAAGTASGREIDDDTLVSVEEVIGGLGGDTLKGDEFANSLWGGDGQDIILGRGGIDRVEGGNGNDRLYGGSAGDRVQGNSGNDRAIGGSGNDKLYGGNGNDKLYGGNGKDTLAGNKGKDLLVGGKGSDDFIYASLSDSTKTSMDTVNGFDGVGKKGGDRFDLSRIDAISETRGNSTFTFDGSHGRGHLWAKNSGGDTIIYGNVDNDPFAELQIRIIDGRISASDYAPVDFVL